MTQQIYSLKLIIFVISNHNTCILASEMASPGNQHCANCIGTLSFPISNAPVLDVVHELVFSSVQFSSCEHAFKQRNAILAAISGGSVYRPLSAFKAQDIDARKYTIHKLSPRGRRDDMPPADGSSTRGGSTSVCGRVRSPHVANLQAASVPIE